MQNYDDPGIVNVGTGSDVTIRELAEIVQRVTGYQGRLVFDTHSAGWNTAQVARCFEAGGARMAS